MLFTYTAIGIALFFAMNIGASGTAASMGAAYGASAIKKRAALILVSIAAFLGAVLGGGEVVKTIGKGIIPSDLLTVKIVIIILLGATLTLFVSNLLGIPLSTSEVTVGAVVGVGLAYHRLFTDQLLVILLFWVIVPIASFIITFVAGKMISRAEKRWPQLKGQGKWAKWLSILLILGGCWEAFSAGMNNVANAVGPLIGAGIMATNSGLWLGALFVSIGALLMGSRVLETNAKKITKLSLLEGSAISFTGGTLVVVASVFGLPIPLTQVTTCGILGVGAAQGGFGIFQKGIIKRILLIWVISPLFSIVVSYFLINLLVDMDIYNLIVMLSVFIATVGSIKLAQHVRDEQRSVYNEGEGI
ncbi:anion permease [Domibacillus indicus]|uniref:inorganic phosphate transporter n=1 Tax=Domibacillus indicus TaxID=1437523 RepID=UPI00203DFDDD|nr:inorganic phosphate transporter [Domibacillus indicus]MCM3789351.1 anion permease [Domibacillus indicus]